MLNTLCSSREGFISNCHECSHNENAMLKTVSVQPNQGLKKSAHCQMNAKSNRYISSSNAATEPFQFPFDTTLETYIGSYWPMKTAVADATMPEKLDAPKSRRYGKNPIYAKENIVDGFKANISNAPLLEISGGRDHEVG
jgi:hypothetical protein